MINNTVANQYGQSRAGFEQKVNAQGGDMGAQAVNKTLGQFGLPNNSFKASDPSSFNRQMVIPPKMNVSVDAQGQDLRSKADALKSEVMDARTSNYEKLKRSEQKAPLGSFESENDMFLNKFQ